MKLTIFAIALSLVTYCSYATADTYNEALTEWKSHKDVANWLSSNFSFDKSRQKQIGKRLKMQGPSGLLVRAPEKLYEDNQSGYCADSANFAITSLNKINPSYNARWVFIKNDAGRPNHWVTAFDFDGKLYIMDYGSGKKWQAMQGIHGPYNSLDEYRDFLASLDLPNFEAGRVLFRDMPGQID